MGRRQLQANAGERLRDQIAAATRLLAQPQEITGVQYYGWVDATQVIISNIFDQNQIALFNRVGDISYEGNRPIMGDDDLEADPIDWNPIYRESLEAKRNHLQVLLNIINMEQAYLLEDQTAAATRLLAQPQEITGVQYYGWVNGSMAIILAKFNKGQVALFNRVGDISYEGNRPIMGDDDLEADPIDWNPIYRESLQAKRAHLKGLLF